MSTGETEQSAGVAFLKKLRSYTADPVLQARIDHELAGRDGAIHEEEETDMARLNEEEKDALLALIARSNTITATEAGR